MNKASSSLDGKYDDNNMKIYNEMMKRGMTRKAEQFMEEMY
jgi:hypothetical protein